VDRKFIKEDAKQALGAPGVVGEAQLIERHEVPQRLLLRQQ